MFSDPSTLNTWSQIIINTIEIILGVGAIGGFLWGGFIWIIRPIKNLIKQSKTKSKQNDILIQALEKRIIPFIDSMTHEFSPNSGKSIKDQMNRIDDAIRLGELRSKNISNSLVTTGVYECSPTGDFTWVNNALADIFGMSKDEMLYQGWLSGVKHTERQKVWSEWHNAVNNDIPYECEYTVVNQKTRKEVLVRTSAVAHRNLDGEILGFYGTLFIP